MKHMMKPGLLTASLISDYVNLELYLMWRARGMKMETPAVRP